MSHMTDLYILDVAVEHQRRHTRTNPPLVLADDLLGREDPGGTSLGWSIVSRDKQTSHRYTAVRFLQRVPSMLPIPVCCFAAEKLFGAGGGSASACWATPGGALQQRRPPSHRSRRHHTRARGLSSANITRVMKVRSLAVPSQSDIAVAQLALNHFQVEFLNI